METQKDLQELLKKNIHNNSVYKVCILNKEGNIDQVILFQGVLDDVSFESTHFSQEESLFYKNSNTELIVSEQMIHLDDSICNIKKKILKEFSSYQASYEELYLFGCKLDHIDLMHSFQEITNNNDIAFNKPMMGQFLNNLQINDSNIYELLNKDVDENGYSFEELLKALTPYENKYSQYFPLGQNFSSKTDHLFSANPYSILPSSTPVFQMKNNNLLYSFENNVLLNYPELHNNTIYVCLAENVFTYCSNNSIDSNYASTLYYPLLSKQSIYTENDLTLNKQQLLETTKPLVDSSFYKLQDNIDTFHKIDLIKLNEIPYIDNGVKQFHVVLHPNSKTFLPLDIIFKQLTTTENMPFIKYNPGSKKESLVRLFCNKRTKTGKKIPSLNKQQILSLFKHSGKVKQISIYLQKIINTQNIECFIDLDLNGNITLRSITNKLIPTDFLETMVSEFLNPLIQKINSFIESSGYKIKMFKSLDHELVEVINLNYYLTIQVNKDLDLSKYSDLFYGIFDILNFDIVKGANLRYKRVNNYTEMNAISSMFSNLVKQHNDASMIINLVASNFNLDYEDAKNEFIKFQSNHQFINGKYVNKSAELVDHPGFPVSFKLEPFENKLIIYIENIDSVKYLPLLKSYINSFLRFSQFSDDLPVSKDSYLSSIKNNENIDTEPHIDNIILPEAAAVPIQISSTNMFKTDPDIDDDDEDSDDGGFFDDDSDEEDESDNENENEVVTLESKINSKSEDEESKEEQEEKSETKEENPPDSKEDSIMDQANDLFSSIGSGISSLTGQDNKQSGGSTRMFIKKMKQLQPTLFKKSGDNEDSYARNCQANSRRQPVILTNEEKIKIDKEYPGSYDIALPYSVDKNKQFWYICPRYWCLQTNAPLSEEQVKNGECGGKIIPQNAKDPPPGHYIFEFTDKKEHVDKDGNYRQHYPGFTKKVENGCLPCCFKKLNTRQQQDMRKECNVGIDDYSGDSEKIKNIVGIKDDKEKENAEKKLAKNVFLPERFPMPQHRWGFLPMSAELFLRVSAEQDVEKNNKAIIQKNRAPLLRYGVEFSRNQSFVCCLNDLHTAYTDEDISLSEFRTKLANDINIDMFIQSHNGNLVSTFQPKKYVIDNDELANYTTSQFYQSLNLENESQKSFLRDTIASYKNFISYLTDDDSYIDHTYLWDIVTSGKTSLFKEKFNLILLEISDNDITDDISIVCPTNLNKSKLYNINLKTVLLIKNKEYYEPIYQYGNTIKNKTNSSRTATKFLIPQQISNDLMNVIKTIEHTSDKYCKPIQSTTKVYEYKTNIPAISCYEILKENKFHVENQVINYKGKVIALSIKIRTQDEKVYYIPTLPSGLLDNIKIIYTDDVSWNSYEETKIVLQNIHFKSNKQIPCNPMVKVVEDGLVVGILTLSNQFVAVSDFPEDSDDGLDSIKTSSYKEQYFNADKELALKNKVDNKRIETVRNIHLETQFYYAFRNKIRFLLNDYYNYDIKNSIIETIDDNRYLYSVKLEKLIKILKHIVRNHVLFQEIDKEVFETIQSNKAFLTFDKENQFCLKDENKLCLPKTHLVSKVNNENYYYKKMADELLRYKRVRLFMLDSKQYLTIQHLDYKINPEEIILLQSSLFDNYLKDIVPFVTSKYVHNTGFDLSNPSIHPPYSDKITLKQQKQLDTNINDIEFIQQSCKEGEINIKNSNVLSWEKFVSSDSNVITMQLNPLCSFYSIMYVLSKKTGVVINVDNIKLKLIEEYNKLMNKYSVQLLDLFSKQGKGEFVKKLQKSELDIESMIMNEEYFLSNSDLWILSNSYNIPIVLFSNNKFSNLNSKHDWIVLGGNTKEDSYYFIYGTSDSERNVHVLIEPSVLLNTIAFFKEASTKPDFIEHFVTFERFLSNMI